MQGNVSEWCEVESKKQVRQPIKGGSWNRCKDALSVSDTEFIHTETRSYSIGFRPVAESE
jgi:formylglycine-generating enzyme required for sulfatase activity